MRIGMILDQEFPPDPRVENEAISLIQEGHEVFLFCLTYGKQKKTEDVKGIQVKRYKSNKLEYKLSALAYTFPFYSFLMQKKINRFIKETKIEGLHIHDIRIAEAVFNANKKYKLPTILDLHENRPEIIKFYPHLSKFPGKYIISPKKWKNKEEEFIKKAFKVIVVTSESKKEILERINIDKKKLIIVPNTVRKEFYNNFKILPKIITQYSKSFVLLYIGDTGIRRGIITAIKSIYILKNKIDNIKLVIIGKNSSDLILKELVKELRIQSYVDFLGWKEPFLFQSYIICSDICISPLHRNLHHDTTYANKIFQYMSLGKPLLVSDATAQKKLVEKVNAGLVHKEKDADDFSSKVLTLYKDKELRNNLGKNGIDFVRNEFSWEHTSKKLINLYNTLSS